MFEQFKKFEYTLAGRPLVIETGKMAQLANGSCLVRYGETAVLCTATASATPRDGIDFLPLAVDYEEKLYSVGRIPGSWNRREGRPTEHAILASRVIDRPIRPLFPKDLRNDIVLSLTVMSVDQDCSPEIAAMFGASLALTISDIPWNGPIAGVFVGLVDGQGQSNVVAQILGEEGTDGTVDDTGGQNGLLRGLALSLQVTAGDLTGSVHSLLEIDGEGQEVDAVAGLLRSGSAAKNSGVAVANQAGAVGKAGDLTGLDH